MTALMECAITARAYIFVHELQMKLKDRPHSVIEGDDIAMVVTMVKDLLAEQQRI